MKPSLTSDDYVDRSPLPEVRVLSDEEAQAIDAAMHEGKAVKWHQVNDAYALDLQIQMQGCIGGLPE